MLGYLVPKSNYGFYVRGFTEHRTPRRGPSKWPPDEQIQGERVTFIYRTTSPASPLRVARLPRALLYPVFGGDEPHRAVGCWIRRGRRSTTSPCARGTPPLGAVSPPTHELGAQHDGISQARAACFDSTVGLDARTPAKCQEPLVAAEKASQSALSSLSRAATFPSLPNAAIATYC